MNKKTGQIISAFIIGLLSLWLSQTALAQGPNPYCFDVTITDGQVSVTEPITWTYIGGGYTTAFSDSNYITDDNGNGNPGGGIEFYNALPADETITISGTVKHQHTSCGQVFWGVNDSGMETTWGSQNTYREGSNCGGPYISQVITHTGYNGVDKDFSIWNEYGNDRIYSGTFQITWPGCSVYTPGGGSDCATVTDADFTGLISYEDGGWNVEYDNVSIHDGYLDILPFQDQMVIAYQSFIPVTRNYTATMHARSASTGTSSIDIGLLGPAFVGEMAHVDVEETVNEDFGVYTFPITLSSELKLADELNLVIWAGGGELFPDFPGLQIDYLCLSSGEITCVNPTDINYTYTKGNDQYDLNLWAPILLDSSFSTPHYEDIPFYMASPDDLPAGGYKQMVTNFNPATFDAAVNIVNSALHLNLNFFKETREFFGNIISRYDVVAYKSPVSSMLDSITVEFVFYQTDAVEFNVGAMVNGEFQSAGRAALITDPFHSAGWRVYTGTIMLEPVTEPTEYIIVVTAKGIPGFPTIINYPTVYLSEIMTTGCYSGDAYTGACVVSDPSLNGGENGGPDEYYWDWSEQAPIIDGGIVLDAENESQLSQHVFTPNPGAYQLSVTLINDTSDRCELYARGAAETGYEQDDFFNVLLPCVTSVASQTVTADVLLPDDQFEFILTANRGHATVTDICFSLPGGQCLNKNSLFTDGSTGYDGGFTVENGHIILNPGTQIYAIPEPQKPFYTGNGPWILEIEATSAVTGETVLSAITPGLNPVDTTITANHYAQISTTQIITYAITKTDDEQRALTLTGNGPSVYNNDATGRLWLSKYCLMTDTGTIWWGNKDCTTITNPDFLNGLTGWTAISAVGVGGWAILDTNGSVRQTVSFDNLITNPGFESGISGWNESDAGSCIVRSQDTSQSKIGSASMKIAKTCDTASYIYTEASASTDTAYTFGAWVKTTGKYIIRLRQTDGTTYASGVQTGIGNWEFKSISTIASSGTGTLRASFFFNDTTAGNADYYIDGAVLVAGSTIPVEYETPQDATVHWIAKSGISSEITATVSVSSTAGVFSTTQVVGPAIEEFFTPFDVGGDVEVRVAGTTAGLELDFVCLNSGTYTGGGPEGGWTPGVGDGRCSPPPMVVMTNTLTAWLPSIWIWSAQPNNYEVVGAYSAAWLRYIGCTLTDMQKMLEVKLNVIIEKLGATSSGGWADALARIFEAIANMIASIAGVISQLLTLLITIWNSLAPGLGLVWQLMGTLLELLDMIISLLADFAGWLLQMMMTLAQIAMNFILDSATVPGEMLTAYNNAINDPAYDIIPLSAVPTGDMGMQSIDLDCTVPESNYWCGILFGFQIVNQSIGASILYPMVIIGLIISTIFVFRNQLWEYYNFKIK